MPQRFLKPGITTSDAWNAVSYEAQSLYIRLLTLVDDFGRYDGRAAVLCGQCFALRPDQSAKKVGKLVVELHEAVLIQFYNVGGKDFIQMEKWSERARSDKSRFPDPPPILRNPAESCGAQEKDASLVPRSSPSPLHHRHSSDLQAVAWSEQTGWVNVEGLTKDFGEAYPACNFTRQLKQAENWLRANPRKAKKDNWRKFLTNWFKRAQDRGGDIASNAPNGQHPPRQKILSFADRAKRKGEIQEELNNSFRAATEAGLGRAVYTPEEKAHREQLRKEMEAL